MTVGAEQRGMVAGDAVNTAPRVQSAATPGQVWVDETTRLLTTSAISYVDVGTHVMKGKADPVPLWAVRAPAGQGAVPQGRAHRPAGDGDRLRRAGRGEVPVGLGGEGVAFYALAEAIRGRLLGAPPRGPARQAWQRELDLALAVITEPV